MTSIVYDDLASYKNAVKAALANVTRLSAAWSPSLAANSEELDDMVEARSDRSCYSFFRDEEDRIADLLSDLDRTLDSQRRLLWLDCDLITNVTNYDVEAGTLAVALHKLTGLYEGKCDVTVNCCVAYPWGPRGAPSILTKFRLQPPVPSEIVPQQTTNAIRLPDVLPSGSRVAFEVRCVSRNIIGLSKSTVWHGDVSLDDSELIENAFLEVAVPLTRERDRHSGVSSVASRTSAAIHVTLRTRVPHRGHDAIRRVTWQYPVLSNAPRNTTGTAHDTDAEEDEDVAVSADPIAATQAAVIYAEGIGMSPSEDSTPADSSDAEVSSPPPTAVSAFNVHISVTDVTAVSASSLRAMHPLTDASSEDSEYQEPVHAATEATAVFADIMPTYADSPPRPDSAMQDFAEPHDSAARAPVVESARPISTGPRTILPPDSDTPTLDTPADLVEPQVDTGPPMPPRVVTPVEISAGSGVSSCSTLGTHVIVASEAKEPQVIHDVAAAPASSNVAVECAPSVIVSAMAFDSIHELRDADMADPDSYLPCAVTCVIPAAQLVEAETSMQASADSSALRDIEMRDFPVSTGLVLAPMPVSIAERSARDCNSNLPLVSAIPIASSEPMGAVTTLSDGAQSVPQSGCQTPSEIMFLHAPARQLAPSCPDRGLDAKRAEVTVSAAPPVAPVDSRLTSIHLQLEAVRSFLAQHEKRLRHAGDTADLRPSALQVNLHAGRMSGPPSLGQALTQSPPVACNVRSEAADIREQAAYELGRSAALSGQITTLRSILRLALPATLQ